MKKREKERDERKGDKLMPDRERDKEIKKMKMREGTYVTDFSRK